MTGCGSKTKTPVLTSISISPPSAKVPIGGKQQFTAVAKDQNGKEMDGITFAWTVDQKEIGEIDKNGVFTGTSAGKCKVHCLAKGKTASAEVEVYDPRTLAILVILVIPVIWRSAILILVILVIR